MRQLYNTVAVVILVLTVVAASQTEAVPVPDVDWDDVRESARETASNAYNTLSKHANQGWNWLKWGTKRVVNAAQEGLKRIDSNIQDPYQSRSSSSVDAELYDP